MQTDILYFVAWAVVHSILASLSVKAWAKRIFGERVQRYYRLFFVSFAVVTLIPLLIRYLIQPAELIYSISSPWRWVMLVGQGISLLALVIATWQSGLFQFIGISQALAETQHFTGNLVTTGAFRYVRHPLYLFSILFMWLSPKMTQKQAVLYGLITLYFIVGSLHEEQILEDEFGEAFTHYKKQVPRFIPVPGHHYKEEDKDVPK